MRTTDYPFISHSRFGVAHSRSHSAPPKERIFGPKCFSTPLPVPDFLQSRTLAHSFSRPVRLGEARTHEIERRHNEARAENEPSWPDHIEVEFKRTLQHP